MPVDVRGMLASLGVDLTGLETQATNYLLQQAATWARVPTRLARDSAALAIIKGAAAQHNRADVVARAAVTGTALQNLSHLYDSASGTVADVVDAVRVLAPGQLPPASLIPQAAKAAAAMRAVLSGLTGVEQQITGMGSAVLTPEQQRQLLSGLSFPSFLAGSVKKLALYALVGVPVYLFVTKRGRGTKSW